MNSKTPIVQTVQEDLTKKRFKNGLIVEEVVEGEGDEVCLCETVTVHMRGWTKGGKEIVNTYKRTQPEIFTLGAGGIILGLEQGIPGMKEGGVRRIHIPEDMGFRDAVIAGVPSYSELIFEVELLTINQW